MLNAIQQQPATVVDPSTPDPNVLLVEELTIQWESHSHDLADELPSRNGEDAMCRKSFRDDVLMPVLEAGQLMGLIEIRCSCCGEPYEPEDDDGGEINSPLTVDVIR